ncbi:MAG: hypothetical protein Q7S22_07925 [Candidatus Micrarchaeota archaeon]|nr:hypothetical protein [Candidatus Micrarchaeota archaeon]
MYKLLIIGESSSCEKNTKYSFNVVGTYSTIRYDSVKFTVNVESVTKIKFKGTKGLEILNS